MQPGKLLLCSTILLCFSIHASSQSLLKKLKQKVESTTEKVIDKKINEKISGGNSADPDNPGLTKIPDPVAAAVEATPIQLERGLVTVATGCKQIPKRSR